MIFVCPFSHYDEQLALKMVEWIKELNGTINADCVAICTETCDPYTAKKIIELLASIFIRERTCLCPIVPEWRPAEHDTHNGWPGGPNQMFRITCEQMLNPTGLENMGFPARVREQDSFYYCEPDNTPMVNNWWDLLNSEYDKVKSTHPCMGAMNLHERTDFDGVFRKGEHLVGTAVYPRDILERAPLIATAKEIAWDTWAGEQIVPIAHRTDLIQHRHGTRHYFTFDIVSEKAAVLHGCKDGSLIGILRAKRNGQVIPRPKSFLHHGDLGDIIYCLPAIKYLVGDGKGILYLSNKFAGQRETMTAARIALIRPLLMALPYIEDVILHEEGTPVDASWWGFRSRRGLNQNLAWNHLDFMGCKLDEHQKKWIEIDAPSHGKVVIHRSPRYHNPNFNWKEIVDFYKEENILMVGVQSEVEEFNKEFGTNLALTKTENLLELAKVIKGSLLFVGNQSCPFAIAEAMKHSRILEVFDTDKNCNFDSVNAQYILNDKPLLPKFEEEFKHVQASYPRVMEAEIIEENGEIPCCDPRTVLPVDLIPCSTLTVESAIDFLKKCCEDESQRPKIRMRLSKIGFRKRRRKRAHAGS